MGSATLSPQNPVQSDTFACLSGALELMGCMMGFAIDAAASRMNRGDSEDTASDQVGSPTID